MLLGRLSAKYESNCDPCAIARTSGDLGGASYGVFQFAINPGSLQSFMDFLAAQGYANYDTLAAPELGSLAFDKAWKKVAKGDPEGFLAMQLVYGKMAYYDVAFSELYSAGWNLDQCSDALKEVAYSAAVHYGPGNVRELFQEASGLLENPEDRTEANFIKAVYQVRSMNRHANDWISTKNPPNIVESLQNRMVRECEDALSLLNGGEMYA